VNWFSQHVKNELTKSEFNEQLRWLFPGPQE
jgi:hypothetical protein